MNTATDEILDELADKLWARILGAPADPIEFNLRAKLALEQRMLGFPEPSFGLDRLSATETATYIGLQAATTLHDKHKRWALGVPEPYSIGRKLFWRRSELNQWIETQRPRKTRTTEAEAMEAT